MDEDTVDMRKMFLARISSLEKEVQEKHEVTSEHEKALRSWQNEKSILIAAIEAREGKLARLSELQNQVAELEDITRERDSLRYELVC
jgi:predicted  nucleic acid-binding Zn-ribbon protein